MEPVRAARPGLPALVRRRRRDLHGRAAVSPRARGLAAAATRAPDVAVSIGCGLAPRRSLAAVPRGAAARGSRERAGRAGVAPLLGLALRRGGPPVPPRGRASLAWLDGWCAAYLAGVRAARRRPARRADPPRGRAVAALGAGVLLGRRPMLGAMADELKPVYLLAGSDRPKIERAVRAAARARFGDDAIEHLIAPRGERGRRRRRLQRARAVRRRGTARDRRRASSAGRRRTSRTSPPTSAPAAPATVLALVGDELKKDSPLAKAVREGRRGAPLRRRRSGSCPSGSPSSSRAPVRRPTPEACRALVELVGDDLDELATEIDKLATWAGERPDHAVETSSSSSPRARRPRTSRSPTRGAARRRRRAADAERDPGAIRRGRAPAS